MGDKILGKVKYRINIKFSHDHDDAWRSLVVMALDAMMPRPSARQLLTLLGYG